MAKGKQELGEGDGEMVELRNVCKSFNGARVGNGINFRLEKGFVYTLMDGNEFGKVTLVNIISGFFKPDEGSVELKKDKIARFLPFCVNWMGIKWTFQDLRLVTQMTAIDKILSEFSSMSGIILTIQSKVDK